MTTYKFPFRTIKGHEREFFPVIPILLKKRKNEILTNALVDSGASVSLFQSPITENLEIDMKSGKKIYFEGIGGKITGYLHSVMIKIGDIEFKIQLAFSKEISTSINILGRKGFFDRFIITFNEKKKELILKR